MCLISLPEDLNSMRKEIRRGIRNFLAAIVLVALAEGVVAALAAPRLGQPTMTFLASLLVWTGFAYVLVSLLAWTGGMRILYLGAAAPFYLGSPSFREGWNTDRRLRIDERTSSLAVGTGFGGVLMLLALVLFALG